MVYYKNIMRKIMTAIRKILKSIALLICKACDRDWYGHL